MSETRRLLSRTASIKARRSAEARLKAKLSALYSEVEKEMVRQLKARGVPMTKAARDRLTVILAERTDYADEVADAAVEAAKDGAAGVVEALAAVGVRVTSESLRDATLERLRSEVFTASERTLARLVGNINDELVAAYEAGEGVDTAARRLRDGVFTNMRTYEAERVARIEIIGAQNYGAYNSKIDNHVNYHQWWTAEDARVRTYGSTRGRADHVIMHGQIVQVGSPFSNGLMYPGDRSTGNMAEIANCRCFAPSWFLPEGTMAPVGRGWFYEDELIDIGF